MPLEGPIVMDAETLIALGGQGELPQRLVVFEFIAAASVQAYFPGYAGFIVGVSTAVLNAAVAIGSPSKFPAALPNGGTQRVIDNLAFTLSVTGAGFFYPTRIPFSAHESIYVKTYSAASNVVLVYVTAPIST